MAEGLQCLGPNIRCVIETSNPDVIYNVPNFCICDPVHEKDFTIYQKKDINPAKVNINVIILYVFENKETKMSVSNMTSGSELKQLYAEISALSLKQFRLRMLYQGQEIADEHPLFYHNVQEGSRIQVSIRELS